MARRIARIVAIAVLGLTGALGLYNAATEWANPYSPFQRTVYGGVLLYGVLGVVGAYAAVRRRPWGERVVIAWGVAITFVSGTAPIAYGGSEVTLIAAIASAFGGAAIAAFVLWAVRTPTTFVSHVTGDAR
jgi:hypothetical protein